MARVACRYIALFLFAGVTCLGIGCLGGTGNPSYFPFFFPTGDIIRTHAKPPGWGYFADFDRHAKRIEVRPVESSMPVRGQQVLVATVLDENGKPRRKRRVEWLIEGPGNIIEVDESGYLPGRGYKVDNKYAVSYTDFFEHTITRGNDNSADDFVVGPGQTWCVISSAVEGMTTVTAYAPAISDWDNSRVFVKTQWIDARWDFPIPATVRAGTEHVLTTKIRRHTDQQPVSDYRVRYRLLDDGPPAALYPASVQRTGAPREAMVIADTDGVARVSIQQPAPNYGTSRVAVEVLRPDQAVPGGFQVVGRSETRVDWQAPKLDLTIQAPKTAQLNQDFTVTYGVASNGSVATQDLMVRAVVPPGLEVVSTSPKSTVDRNDLLWSLPGLGSGKQHSLQVVYRPTRTGPVNAAADVRSTDQMRAQSLATIQINEAKLQVAIKAPKEVLVGERVPVEITVANPGNGPTTNIKLKPQWDAGLEPVDPNASTEVKLDELAAGMRQTAIVYLTPKQAGRVAVKAIAVSDGNLTAQSQPLGLEVKKPDLKVEAYAPERAYLNQETTWTIRVFNPSEVALQNVVVRAVLPPEVTFRKASNDGRHSGSTVEWTLGTAVGKQWTDVQVTGVCNRLARSAVLKASAVAEPVIQREGKFQTVAMVKPFRSDAGSEAAVEILGVPALQMEVFDNADPVDLGRKVTYTIRVKNAGTLAATQVELVVELPPELKPLRSFGPTTGKITGQKVLFPPVANLAPNMVSAFTVEAETITAGTAKFRAEVKSFSAQQPIRVEESTRILPR